MVTSYWITNVLLESGYRYKNDHVDETVTELYNLHIDDGIIKQIVSATESIKDELPKKDADKLLMLPSFRDMHMHLDNTYYSSDWKAPTPIVDPTNRFMQRLKEEEEWLPIMLPGTTERAEKIMDLMLRNGTTHLRVQANVDPFVNNGNFYAVKQALENYSDKITYELVAFPQHGLLRSNSVELVKDAIANGATHVGAIDPGNVENNIEGSLHTTFDIAVSENVHVDIHLHDPGHLGVYTMKRIAAYTKESEWQGKVTISHGFALGGVSKPEQIEIARILVDAGIDLVSTVPISVGTTVPPIPLLNKEGMKISLGNDNITDPWGPFGTGDLLHKANIMAERFGWTDELSLAKSLSFITGGVTPLDLEGQRVWPTIGDKANAVFIDASCSAEAVARMSERKATMSKGKIVSGELPESN